MTAHIKEYFPNGIQLRGDIILVLSKDSVELIGKKTLSISSLNAEEIALFKRLRNGIDLSEIDEVLNSNKKEKYVKLLISQKMIKNFVPSKTLSQPLGRQIDWLSHYTSKQDIVMNKLYNSHVVIIGCGGTGCIIAEHLSRSGVKNFTLVDGGKVDAPDLNRQLSYTHDHIERLKTSALSHRLKSIFKDIKTQLVSENIQSKNDIVNLTKQSHVDLIINCADTPIGLIHSWVAEASLDSNVAALFGGVGLEEATIGPLLQTPESKVEYSAQSIKAHKKMCETENIMKASLCFTNSITAVSIAFEAFKFLSGINTDLVSEIPREINFFRNNGATQ